MAQDVSSFRAVRDSLYRSLARCAYVPEVEEADNTITQQIEKRFFPAGTPERILTFNELERLFIAISKGGNTSLYHIRPAQLAGEVGERKLHVFLAILIIANCDIQAYECVIERLVDRRRLPKLPVEDNESLRALFNNEITVDMFAQRQHDFFAPILQRHKEVKGNFRRVPYIREKLIGQGSFGKIYEVLISPYHFDSGHSSFNREGVPLARKDFQLNTEDRAYEKERDVLRDIVRNSKSHKNIMKSMGSFEIGSIYSLFMPLADCDLMRYMELNQKAPESFIKKASLVHCAVGLAGAIVYLHEELESPNYEQLSCFHMDLKPQNILVVTDPDTGEQHWKLSDFNMSRVKMRRRPNSEDMLLRRTTTFGDGVYEVNKLFKRRYPELTDTTVTDFTINRRAKGTYLAPEACIDGHQVHGESDTWSLGCVLSVVFSYIYQGFPAVEEFRDLRARRGLDCFFSFSGTQEMPKLKDAQVNDAVKRWHKHLRMRVKRRDPEEGAIFEDVVNFLDRKVLLIDPKQRRTTSAKEVREKLIVALNSYNDIAARRRGAQPTIKTGSKWAKSLKKLVRRAPEAEKVEQVWRLDLGSAVRSCAFGPNTELFVCIANNTLRAFSLEHVLLAHDTTNFTEDLIYHGEVVPEKKGVSWNHNVGVAGKYVLAATDYHEFECYFYQVPQPGNHNNNLELIARWELKMPKVWKLALSPDGRLAAFILCHSGPQQNTTSLYITAVDWLYSLYSENKNYSIVSSSSGSSSSSSNSPLGRAIPLPCPFEDVCELTFSEANGLYVVSKPRQILDMTANTMHVYAWSLHDGRRTALQPSPIKHDGKDDLLQGLFTFFAPYKRQLAFAVVSQEKRLITRVWELKRYTQSNARGCRLLHVILDEDDREFLAFGTQEANNSLQLFTFPATNMKEDLIMVKGRDLPGMTHRSRFVASVKTISTGSITQRHLLIAVMEDEGIRFIRLTLDP